MGPAAVAWALTASAGRWTAPAVAGAPVRSGVAEVAGMAGMAEVQVGAPVTPSPDDARRLLEVELARPEYQERIGLLQRLLRWFGDRLDGAPGAPLPVGAVLVVALLVLAAAVVVWRLRDVRQVAASRRRREAGLTDPGRSAGDYREQARRELAQGAVDRAAVSAFRALVVDLDDADVVRDAPGRTAHEVAAAAARALPDRAGDLDRAAVAFDAACYGHPDGPLPGPGDPQRLRPADVEAILAVRITPTGPRPAAAVAS